jgi:hypothetical protein
MTIYIEDSTKLLWQEQGAALRDYYSKQLPEANIRMDTWETDEASQYYPYEILISVVGSGYARLSLRSFSAARGLGRNMVLAKKHLEMDKINVLSWLHPETV